MTRFIGISGKPGANKMIYAFRIIRELRLRGHQAEMSSLALSLYAEANAIADDVAAGLPESQIIAEHDLGILGPDLISFLDPELIGEKHPQWGHSRRNESFRRALSLLGTNIRREQDQDYFLKRMVSSLEPAIDFAVITDLRFPNEAEYIRRHGGMNIRVNVNDEENTSGGYKYNEGRNTAEETALDTYYRFNHEFYASFFNGKEFGNTLEEFFQLNASRVKYP